MAPNLRVATLELGLQQRHKCIPERQIAVNLLSFVLAATRTDDESLPNDHDRIGADLFILAMEDLGWTPPSTTPEEATD